MLALLAVYPFLIPVPSAQDVASREAEFRHRNPQAWKEVTMGHEGYVVQAIATDEKLAHAGLPELRVFLRANADLFGIAAADVELLAPMTLGTGLELVVATKELGVLEQVVIFQSADLVSFTSTYRIQVPEATVAVPGILDLIGGKRYRETVTYTNRRELDCDMVEGGCQTTPYGTVSREIVVKPGQVGVWTTLHGEGNVVRYVRCVDLEALPFAPTDPKWPKREMSAHRTFTPLSKGAPAIPYVVDAVTGETLPLHPARCQELRNVR